MAQTVKLKRSAVAAKVPLTSDLALGELAANTCDGVLYTLMNDGTNKVVQVGGQSVSATVTAGTNAQGQGPLTSNVNLVTTTTANPSGVTLPTALLGRKLLVFNRGTNPINVYPATGAQIDALGTNVSIQIPVKGWLEFNATSTTQWYSSFGAFINNGSNIYSSISKAPGSNSENFFAGTCAGSTTGNYNNYIGYCAGALSSGSDCNNFFGKFAGVRTTGDKNNFFGPYAGCSTLGGYSNNFFGDFAGCSNTTGCYNVFLGSGAGFSNLTASNNIAIGKLPGYNNTTGANNIFLGSDSATSNTTASNVIAIGNRAGSFNNGDRNIFLGQDTGYLTGRLTCITGADNFITGFGAGASLTTGCRNTFIGVNAGCGATGANCNLIVGWNAGKLNGTGRDNIFLGACTGAATAGGISNVFIGRYAGAYASSSTQNVFIGAYAGSYNNAGGQNVFLGTNSGYCNTTGCNNYFVGFSSGLLNTTGSGNFFVGCTAGNCNTTTSGSIAVGNRAGFWNQGNQNIYLGQDAGYVAGRLNTTTGSENFVVGCNAGARITTGSKNIIIGCKAGSNAGMTGGGNHLFGTYAGYALTSGRYNNFFGLNSGCGVTTGQYNNYFGYLTGQYSNGSGNFFAGRQAGYYSTGSDNLFIGNLSGTDNTSGGCNIGLGWLSARYNTTGTENVFIGSQAGQANTVTGASVAIGCNAGYWNNGASNIYIGNCAGRSATRAACTTGANNLVVGRQSGLNITTGAQNSFLGAYAGCLTTTGSCNVIVGGFTGTGFTTSSNHIFLADGAGTNRLIFNNTGALGINGANYGSAGQVLTSCGSSLAPVWANPGTVTASNSVLDSITAGFNGTTATFNLTLASVAYTPSNAAQLTVVLGGVVQKPGTDFTVSTSTITFTTAPVSGLDCFIIANGGYTNVIDGDKGDITVSANGSTWTIDANVVTNAKLAQVATSTFKGRVTAATGNVEDLTGTQATTLLDTFTSALKGLAPASGGGTTNFLRADGTWAAPSGVSLSANNAFTGANTFTNATGQIFRQAATQDGILLRGRAGGTTSLTVELIPGTLTASRTLTAPDVSGTIITTGDTGTVTNTMLAGSIANNKLLNSAITVNGSSTSLGGSVTLYAGTTTLQTSSANQALTGISSVTLPGATSGTVQVIPTAVAGTGTVLTLPATTGTVITSGDTGSVTNTMLAGSIANNKLLNSAISVNGASTSLGGSVSLFAGTTTLQTSSANQALTGISSVTLPGSTSGSVQIIPTAAAGTGTVLTLPATTGTVVTTGDTGSVTGTMIVDGTITNAEIATNAAIATSKLASFTAGQVLLGNATGVPTATTLSGDITVNSSGVTAIGTGVIVDAEVSATAAIAGTKIAPNFGAQLIQSSQANQALSLTGSLNPATTSNGLLSVGTLGFSGSRMGANFTSSQTSYYQVVLQNTSNNAGASTDFVVCNDASTDTTTYGNFGINSSAYSGSGSFSLPNATYVTATTGDLVLGTTTSNQVRFVVNSGATDAFGINTSGAWLVAGSAGTSGQTYRSGGSAAAPSWSNIGTSQVVSLTATQQSTTTALANVTQLVASLEANATYTVDCFVTFQSSATTNGLILGFTSPTGCNPMVEIVVPIVSTAAASALRITFPNAGSTTSGSVTGTGVTAINSNHTARLSGIIKNGGTAGNFQIQFATEVGTQTITLQIGSTMQLTRIA